MLMFLLTMSRSRIALVSTFSVILVIVVVVSVACGGGQPPTATPASKPPLNASLQGTPGAASFSSTLVPPSKSGVQSTLAQPQTGAPAAGGPVSFSRDLQPVIRQQCGACHIDQSLGGLSLRDYNALVKGGQKGSPVVKNDPDGSLLVRKLRGDPGAGARMPTGAPPLPDATIKLFADWIAQGAQNN